MRSGFGKKIWRKIFSGLFSEAWIQPYSMFRCCISEKSSTCLLLSQPGHDFNVEVKAQKEWKERGNNIPEPELINRIVRLFIAPLRLSDGIRRQAGAVPARDYLKKLA